MSEDLYRCVCHTCETERLIEGLENAQEVFSDHADRGHEVELFNRESLRRCSNAPPAGDEREDDASVSEDE